ncbi:MAG: hypothetical protein PHV06_00035 [bacterium]|nr:hypothetical protein [bacterium]
MSKVKQEIENLRKIEFRDLKEMTGKKLLKIEKELLRLNNVSPSFLEAVQFYQCNSAKLNKQIKDKNENEKNLEKKIRELNESLLYLKNENKELQEYRLRLKRISKTFFYKVYSLFHKKDGE